MNASAEEARAHLRSAVEGAIDVEERELVPLLRAADSWGTPVRRS
jgi:hypothetical protein